METWNKYKGVVTILLTLITLGGSILYKVAKIESMAVENTVYRKDSEKARKFFEIEFVKFSGKLDKLLEIAVKNSDRIEDINDDFDKYKEGQEEIIRKFYYLNKNLKDPRVHPTVDAIGIKGIESVVIQERKEESIKEYVKL